MKLYKKTKKPYKQLLHTSIIYIIKVLMQKIKSKTAKNLLIQLTPQKKADDAEKFSYIY